MHARNGTFYNQRPANLASAGLGAGDMVFYYPWTLPAQYFAGSGQGNLSQMGIVTPPLFYNLGVTAAPVTGAGANAGAMESQPLLANFYNNNNNVSL